MSKPAHTKQKSKRKGCLLIALTMGFVVLSGFYFLTTGVREAKRLEQTLIDRFDWADKYTPAIDGSIAAPRIEAFIRVREAVQTVCADYQAILISINDLNKLEDDQDKPATEVASTGMQGFRSAFSAGPKMLEFSETRNQALLDENMGLGEYLYIYLTSYGEQLASESDSAFSDMDEAFVSDRARKEFVQILTNQLLAIQASEPQNTNPLLITDLQVEIEALKDGSHLSPWPNGPIGKAHEALAPYQQRLSELYCSGIVKIELLQKNRGFQLEG